MFENLPFSPNTTPIESEVKGNCSITPFLLATSIYPLSKSSSVKNLTTSLSKVAKIAWHISSISTDGTIAMKSSPPIWPTKEPSGNILWMHFRLS